MQENVKSALSQKLKPLLSNRNPQRDQGRLRLNSQFQKHSRNSLAQPEVGTDLSSENETSHLKLVVNNDEGIPAATPSVATEFLKLFTSLQQKRGDLVRIFGSRNYQGSISASKKSSRFRKGSLLDEEVG